MWSGSMPGPQGDSDVIAGSKGPVGLQVPDAWARLASRVSRTADTPILAPPPL